MKPENSIKEKHSKNISSAKTNYSDLKYKFSELRKQGDLNCRSIDENNMGIAIAEFKSKWLNIRYDYTVLYQETEEKRKNLRRDLYEFYKIDYQLKIDTREELNLFIESDKRYKDIYKNSLLIKNFIDYCDSIIETLEKKSWALKTMLEWRKFNEGL